MTAARQLVTAGQSRALLRQEHGIDLPAQLRAPCRFRTGHEECLALPSSLTPCQTVSAQHTSALLGLQATNCKPEQFALPRVWAEGVGSASETSCPSATHAVLALFPV